MNDWISRREFDRLEGAVNEIRTDVKLLLAAYNREEGATEERRELLDATRDKGARRLAWGGLLVAAVGALSWAQNAIASLVSHH